MIQKTHLNLRVKTKPGSPYKKTIRGNWSSGWGSVLSLGDPNSIPGRGTKSPHTEWQGKKKKENYQKHFASILEFLIDTSELSFLAKMPSQC